MQDAASKVTEPIFSRKKSLLTIGQYAVHQGVSAGIVQECAKLGVVQVRKHKDKTFIVDLPLDIHKIIKQQNTLSDYSSVAPPSGRFDISSCEAKISELVHRIFQPESKPQPSGPAKPEKAEEIKVVEPAIAETPAASEELSLQPHPAAARSRPKGGIEPEQAKFRAPFLRGFTDTIRTISTWRISFVLTTIACAASICAYAWVSMDRKVQQEKLQQAYESINKLMTKYEDTKQQAKLYQFDMMSWQADAERSKKALYNSETELQNVRKSLYQTQKDLESMRQYNSEALKELNDKITTIKTDTFDIQAKPAE